MTYDVFSCPCFLYIQGSAELASSHSDVESQLSIRNAQVVALEQQQQRLQTTVLELQQSQLRAAQQVSPDQVRLIIQGVN